VSSSFMSLQAQWCDSFTVKKSEGIVRRHCGGTLNTVCQSDEVTVVAS
jgi:hypothetical protein